MNKVAELAIIYNKILQQLFTARRGGGAFFNGNKMHVSGQTDITKSLIITDIFAYRQPEKLDTILENIQKIINVSHGYGLFTEYCYFFISNSIECVAIFVFIS